MSSDIANILNAIPRRYSIPYVHVHIHLVSDENHCRQILENYMHKCHIIPTQARAHGMWMHHHMFIYPSPAAHTILPHHARPRSSGNYIYCSVRSYTHHMFAPSGSHLSPYQMYVRTLNEINSAGVCACARVDGLCVCVCNTTPLMHVWEQLCTI